MGVPILNKINVQNLYPSKSAKKPIEEKSKVLGYIGMEVWDLKKQGKINMPELDVYFEKLEALEKEISDIEAEKQRLGTQKKGGSICSCGFRLAADDRFCPQCGKAAETGFVVCACGNQVKSGMQFCPYCGKTMQKGGDGNFSMAKTEETSAAGYKECICGAKVPEGQFMCMECGRKIG